jgi:hypothetical protein
MDRRAYLGGVAGVASLLAGCSGGVADDRDTPTVTPVPLPGHGGGGSGPLATEDGVNPPAVGDAHVDELRAGNARIAVEYAAVDGADEPVELTRIVSTVDGPELTHRRYVLRPLDLGGTYELFRGLWFDGEDAVTRLIEVDNRSIYRKPDEFAPPPAAERFHRADLVGTLAAFRPGVESVSGGYRLAADRVADPARLPIGDAVEPGREGRIRGRIESAGLVPALAARATAAMDGDPLTARYRLSVTDRGSTTVERPTPLRTFEWFEELQAASPVRVSVGESVGMGDPPGRSEP